MPSMLQLIPSDSLPEVEYAFARRNPVRDYGEVEALSLLGPDSPFLLGHTLMFSR